MAMNSRLALLSLLLLGGCSLATAAPGSVPSLAGVEAVTVIGTDKTLGDHIVSFTTGKNCSTIRRKTGQTYCEEDEVMPPEEIYCYRTLGKVSCYGEPRPASEHYNTVGHTPAPHPERTR